MPLLYPSTELYYTEVNGIGQCIYPVSKHQETTSHQNFANLLSLRIFKFFNFSLIQRPAICYALFNKLISFWHNSAKFFLQVFAEVVATPVVRGGVITGG